MNESKRDILFSASFILYLCARCIEITTIYYTIPFVPTALKLARYLAYALVLIISLFYLRFTHNEFQKYLGILVLLTVVSYVAQSVTILFDFIIVFASKDFLKGRVIKYAVIIQVIISICVVAGTMGGIIDDWIYLQGHGLRIRHSLGYGYPNTLPAIYFYATIAICYLLKDRYNTLYFAALELLNYWIFLQTNTRTAFLLTAVALLAFYILQFYKKPLIDNRTTRLVYLHSVWIIAIAAIIACRLYNPNSISWLNVDSFINYRLSLGHKALMENHLTLFGQKIEWYGYGGYGYTFTEMKGVYNYVDCSYLKILLDHGIIMLALAVIGYMFAVKEEMRKGDRFFCVAILFANVYSMLESRYILISLNPYVWCFSSLLRNDLVFDKTNKRLRIVNTAPIQLSSDGLTIMEIIVNSIRDSLPKTIWEKLRFIKACFRRLILKAFWIFPVDPNKIIFDNYHGIGYGDNSKAIAERFACIDNKKLFWLCNGDYHSFPPFIHPIKEGSICSYYHIATAGIWVDNCRKESYFEKRK